MNKIFKISIVTLLALNTLYANETIKLKPLTISSTAIKTDELKSTDAVEVYTSKDIEKSNVTNLYEFLNQQTSIVTMPSYGNQFTQKIDMRGYGLNDGYQNIVITLDGRRLNNMDLVPQLLGSIQTSSIKFIEIIKSSGVVVGGDGANAGVINITTKNNNDKEVSLYAGTYGLVDGSFYLGHNKDKLSISLSGELQESDVIRDISPSSSKHKNKLQTASLNLSYLATNELELRLAASATNTENIYSGYLSKAQVEDNIKQEGASTTIQELDTRTLNLGFSYDLNNEVSINIDGYTEDKESKYDYVTYFFKSKAEYDYQALKSNITYDSKNLSVIIGHDYYDSERETSLNTLTKQSNAVYALAAYNFGKNSVKAGLRYENVKFKSISGDNQDDDLWGAELGFNHTLNSDMSLFLNYSHSYQSADLDRLFSYSTGAFIGYVNPAEADNFNIGFNYITSSNKFKITAYYIDLEDEIYYYVDPTYINSKNTNIDESHKYGLDIYDKWIINKKFNVVANYNYVQAKIDKELEDGNNYAGNDLPGVSDHNAKATLSYLPSNTFTIALTQVYRSEAYALNDFNNNFSQKQKEFISTDIALTYKQKSYEVFAKINNLFDRDNGLWVEDDAIYPVNFTTTAMAGFKLKF